MTLIINILGMECDILKELLLMMITGSILFVALIIQKTDIMKDDRYFKWKKVIDIIVSISSYIFIVIISSATKGTGTKSVFVVFVFMFQISVTIYKIVLIINQLYLFNRVNRLTKDLKFIFASLLMGIITSFSSIYFLIYIYNPSWFYIEGDFGLARLAFEFIYHTFFISVSYSPNTILAIGVIPKIVEMLHISIFYLFLSNIILSVISKNKEDKK